MSIEHEQQILLLVRQEVLDRYDIYDIITLLNLELEDLYSVLETRILANLEELNLESIDERLFRHPTGDEGTEGEEEG